MNTSENEDISTYRLTDNTEITDNAEKVNRQSRQIRQNLNIGNYPEYLSTLSKTDKLKAYLSDAEGLTDKEAAAFIYGDAEECKKVADLRANISAEVEQCSDTRPAKYRLKIEARTEVMRAFNSYLLELQRKAELTEEQHKIEELPGVWREFLKTDLAEGSPLERAQAQRSAHGSPIFRLQWGELIRLQPELAEALENDVQDQVRSLQNILQSETGTDWNVVIEGFDDRSKIAKIRSSDYERLINLHCEVASIGELRDRSMMKRFECPSCACVIPISMNLERRMQFDPKKCPSCHYKGKLRLASEEVVTTQAILIQDIVELLQPGEQPRRLPAMLLGPLAEVNAERFAVSNKITVTGCYIRQREEGSAEYTRIFLIYGAAPLNEAILHVPASPEVLAEVARIKASPDPLKSLAEKVYRRVVGHDLAKELCMLQAVGNLHILLLGLPGLGKTEVGKSSVAGFSRSDFIQSSNASRAGLTAAASKDEHTGRFVVESNALVRLNPHGIAVIDELDKAKEDVQFALLGVMQDRALTINKTNVQARLPCDVNILATANPRNDVFDKYSQLWEQVNIVRPLYDRFSFVVLFNQDLAKLSSFKVFFEKRELKQESLSIHDRLVLREIIQQAWSITPKVTDDPVTLDQLDLLMRDVIIPHPSVYGRSLRLTEVLPALLEALCRLTGDERPAPWHFQKATDILMRVKENHAEALQ